MAKRRRRPAVKRAAPARVAWSEAVALFATFTKARDRQDAGAMRASLAKLGPLLSAGDEAQAAATGTLSAKHARFVAEYLIDLNASAAYRRAGYAAKDADVNASALMGNHGIQAAIAAGKARQLSENELSAARTLEELRRLAFANIRNYFDADGDVKPPQSLSVEDGAAVVGFEVLIKNAKAGDGVTDTIHKFRLADKVRALEALAKHQGLLVEKFELVDSAARVARLQAARVRAAADRVVPVDPADVGPGA